MEATLQPSLPHTELAREPLKVPKEGPEILRFSQSRMLRGVGMSLGYWASLSEPRKCLGNAAP